MGDSDGYSLDYGRVKYFLRFFQCYGDKIKTRISVMDQYRQVLL